nr:FAD-binding protein [Gammaproteobacteria bacterium]
MSVLILAEHDGIQLRGATLNVITAGLKLADSVDVLVAGSNVDTVADGCKSIKGVAKILLADHESFKHCLAECVAPLIKNVAERYQYVLAPCSSFGKNVMPRAAALLDVGQLSDVVEILSEDTFKRYIYAGNALATVKSVDAKKIITVRTTVFDAAEQGDDTCTVERVDYSEMQSLAQFVALEASDNDLPSLSEAEIVISGGRGLQDKAGFERLAKIAAKMQAALGASRAAVDAGLAPNDSQVGQTGQIVAPKLYIAVGISGAIQHLAGMKDSKVVVAINKDPDAPIFEVADYGLVADLFEVLPQWEAWLE